jgi:hypothetical protein
MMTKQVLVSGPTDGLGMQRQLLPAADMPPQKLTAAVCRVGMWRGGCRLNISVAAPFVWRCRRRCGLATAPE